MAGNFMSNGPQYGSTQMANSGMNFQTTTVPSLMIMPSNSRQFAEQYPVAPNVTMVFINYNQKKLWIKTMHSNSLAYDFEEFNLLNDNDIVTLQQQVANQSAQNQNGFVPRQEFESLTASVAALRKQLEEFIK